MQPHIKGIIAVLVAIILWSTTYLATKIAIKEIPPITLGLLRSIIASLALLIVILKNKELKKVIQMAKEDFWIMPLLGLTGVFLLNFLQNIGLTFSETALMSVLINTSPIFIIIFAKFFLKERVGKHKITGIIIGAIGMAIFMFANENISTIFKSKFFLGNIMAIGIAISWGTYSVMTKHLLKEKYKPLVLTFVSNLFGIILFLPFVFAFEDISKITSVSLEAWANLLYLALGASCIALLLWNYGISKISVSRAAIYDFLNPVIAVSIGVFYLNEKFTLINFIGTIIILTGIYLTEHEEHHNN